MAMKKCKECGKEVSTSAKLCPHCGKKYPTGGLTMPAKIFLGILALFVLGKIVGDMGGSSTSSTQTSPKSVTSAPTKETVPQASQNIKPENWSYGDSLDKMGRGKIRWASASSINTVSFDFPYSGPQHGTLDLRIHPQYGKDVILRIERGQFLTGIDGCKVLVRFDEGKPQNFWGNGPSDHSTTSLFISDYSRFVSALKKAKRIIIQAPFYQEGNQVFEFNVEGLKWETSSSAKKEE